MTLNNSIIVAKSTSNPNNDSPFYAATLSGVTTPRTGSSNLTNVRFYNFPSASAAITTCSQCNFPAFFTNLGTEIFTRALAFKQITGKYISMSGVKRDVLYDRDGSLSTVFDGQNRTNATLVYNYPHISKQHPLNCSSPQTASAWDNSLLCDSTILIRRVYFTNLWSSKYYYNVYSITSINIAPIANISVNHTTLPSNYITTANYYLTSDALLEKSTTWSLPFVAGSKYEVWWSNNVDFDHLSLSTTPLYLPTD